MQTSLDDLVAVRKLPPAETMTRDQRRWYAKVDIPENPLDCWLWTASTNFGYGIFWHIDTMHKAHRWGWQQFVGPIPEDKPHLLHSCHVRHCVNPNHLRPGTTAENMRDRDEAGRAARLRGESNGMSKLTDEQAAEIKRRREAGELLRVLADDYDVSMATISKIGLGQRLTAESGEEARDRAMAEAEANAHAEWLAFALLTVKHLGLLGGEFTTDDLWERLELYDVRTHEPRAMGAVMKRAVRDGLIEPTGRYVKSSRKECHARPVQTYRGVRW